MLHPPDETLALYAGSDVDLWTRFRIGRHLGRCERCSRHVEEFRGMRDFLETEQGELPRAVEWGRLAAEMKANIRLGLAAGECVSPAEPDRIRIPWRTPAVALPLLLIIIAGWILQSVPPLKSVRAPGAVVEATGVVLDGGPAGIGVEQDGRGFRLLHPRAADSIVYSVGSESVNARYVDADTGQVTISHVYAE
jgi:anti-sigma factor RsiW